MPSRSNRDQLERELKRLREPLEKWRMNEQTGRRRIPEKIWDRAAELAAQYGIAAVSGPLRLGHATLKGRVQARRQAGEAMVPVSGDLRVAPTFVELFGTAPNQPTLAPCILQIESHRGSRVRVEVGGLDAAGLAILLREFA